MIRIRPAHVDDVPALLSMLIESAAAQGFPGEVVVTEEDLRQDGFGANPLFHILVAEAEGNPAGLALYFFNYSTWVSRLGLYLEDLYVRPEFRRHGIARDLMKALARIALEQGCGRFQWLVHKQNTRAVQFYTGLGAAPAQDWLLMSLKGESLRSAAESTN
jgi:GNAT superfamily N-acetyltransferase